MIRRAKTRGDAAPLVSVCIPTYQGAPWIQETLASAIAQDYSSFEIVVCDDASDDGTAALAESVGGSFVRVHTADRRLGMAANWNWCIQAARGEYIKLLMQDDLLERDCLSTMAAVLDRHPNVGFVFSPRKVLLDDPGDVRARRWQNRYGVLHDRLGPLKESNDGRRLFATMRQDSFKLNCFGEPTAVMVRRAAFERVGLFARRMPQLLDEEMWLRLAYFFDVGFVPRPLVSVRVHRASATNRNAREGAAWLDPLWLLEGLREHPELRGTITRRTELLMLMRAFFTEAKRVRRMGLSRIARYPGDIHDYLRFKLTRRRPTLHDALAASDASTWPQIESRAGSDSTATQR